MARLPYPDPAGFTEGTARTLERLPPLRIFRMAAHAQDNARRMLRYTFALWSDAELSARDRELAILVVAQLCEAEYEWRQHVPVALEAGVTPEQVEALRARRFDDGVFDARDRSLLALSRDLVLVPRCDDAVFAAAREHFSDREIVEIHMVIGAYWSVARIMTNLDLELDDPAA